MRGQQQRRDETFVSPFHAFFLDDRAARVEHAAIAYVFAGALSRGIAALQSQARLNQPNGVEHHHQDRPGLHATQQVVYRAQLSLNKYEYVCWRVNISIFFVRGASGIT